MPSREDDVLGYVAANVRRIRLRLGKTQAQLAEEADQDLSYVQRIERGVTNLSVGVLVLLADALGVSPESLLRPARPLERATGRPPRKKKPQRPADQRRRSS